MSCRRQTEAIHWPDMKREKLIGLRVTPAEERALERLLALRAKETGDGTFSGWFRVLLRREAKEAGFEIGDGAAVEDTPDPAQPADHAAPPPKPEPRYEADEYAQAPAKRRPR